MSKRWCSHCAKLVEVERPFDGSSCCSECGKVFELYNFSSEPTFVKNAAGQSSLSGRIVDSVHNEYASRQRTLDRAEDEMKYMCLKLGMSSYNVRIVNAALAFYRMALEKNFTRGRRSEQVQAACMYIACREEKQPYLLIDFSNMLQINVYVLGAVFLQLCKVLWLEEHQIVQKPLDPSLFIHKYTHSLSGSKRNNDVARTALRIIASMRRDWMQTGRKPSGLWGAAVYISALAHGLKCSKNDVLRLVHICEATLTKRLVEFENTESGSLTVEELNAKARDEENNPVKHPNIGSDQSISRELLCQHKGTEIPHYAIGLCQSCYNEFVEFSGGLEGGSDPPAFQRAEGERLALAAAEKAKESNLSAEEPISQSAIENGKVHSESGKIEDSKFEERGLDDESDNLSDIDDIEVDSYLHNEKEKEYKRIIWEQMNREYLEEQAAKEAATAAAREAAAANFKGSSADMQAAQELAAATAAALAKSKKERQQKRAAEAKNAKPPQTAAEATRQILMKKRLSSKVNYDVLEKLFDEPAAPDNEKKKRKESQDNDKATTGKKHKSEKHKNEDDLQLGEEHVMEDEEMATYDDYQFDEDAEEAYGYNDDDWL